MDISLVLKAHSAFAASCGTVAIFLPEFFGSVFPSLASSDTLRFIVRVYSILLSAQVPLLHGIRQTEGPILSGFCTVYALIFGGTAAVTAHSDFALGVVREDGRPLLAIWLCLVAVYTGFALAPIPRYFKMWSVVHMGAVALIGLAGLLMPEECNVRFFLVPNRDAYATVSRYYGVLICGMSLLAFTATRAAARSALSSMRAGFSAMFAASGACLALYLYERQQLDPVGGGSLLMFVTLSALYGTARLPPLRTKGG